MGVRQFHAAREWLPELSWKGTSASDRAVIRSQQPARDSISRRGVAGNAPQRGAQELGYSTPTRSTHHAVWEATCQGNTARMDVALTV